MRPNLDRLSSIIRKHRTDKDPVGDGVSGRDIKLLRKNMVHSEGIRSLQQLPFLRQSAISVLSKL